MNATREERLKPLRVGMFTKPAQEGALIPKTPFNIPPKDTFDSSPRFSFQGKISF